MENERNLVAAAHLSVVELRDYEALGAMPSLLVSVGLDSAKIPEESEVILLMKPEKLDPAVDERNLLFYAADVERYLPKVLYRLDKKKIQDVVKEIYGASTKDIGSAFGRSSGYDLTRQTEIFVNDKAPWLKLDFREAYALLHDHCEERGVLITGAEVFDRNGNLKPFRQITRPYSLENLLSQTPPKEQPRQQERSIFAVDRWRANLIGEKRSFAELRDIAFAGEESTISDYIYVAVDYSDMVREVAADPAWEMRDVSGDRTDDMGERTTEAARAVAEREERRAVRHRTGGDSEKGRKFETTYGSRRSNHHMRGRDPDGTVALANRFVQKIDQLNVRRIREVFLRCNVELSDASVDRILEAGRQVTALPVENLNLIAHRAVEFEEIACAILSAQVPEEVSTFLKRRGVECRFYAGPGDRKRLLCESAMELQETNLYAGMENKQYVSREASNQEENDVFMAAEGDGHDRRKQKCERERDR